MIRLGRPAHLLHVHLCVIPRMPGRWYYTTACSALRFSAAEANSTKVLSEVTCLNCRRTKIYRSMKNEHDQ